MSISWKRVKLEKVCEKVTVGHVGKTSSYYCDDGVKFLRTQNVGKYGLKLNDVRYVTTEFHESLKKSQLIAGDVLISRVVTDEMRCAIVPPELGPANCANIILLRPGSGLNSCYLYYLINSPYAQQYLLDRRVGSAQQVVNTKVLKDWEIPVPPLPEQKRIVAILDEAFAGIDTAIANTEKNLANARELFDSYLNSILAQRGAGWVETTIGELCEKVEYGSSSKSKPDGSIPVIRMGNIQDGVIDWDKLVYTDNAEEIDKYLLNVNDVLFNRTNSPELVGKTAIYTGERPAIFAGYLIRLHRKEHLIDAHFLNYYLNSIPAREHGKTVMSSSVNQANINGTKLKQYPLAVPSLEEQQNIVLTLHELSEKTKYLESINHQKLKSLNELKQSLLQKAFSGELTAADETRWAEAVA